jgi:hypothetical protein
MRTLALVAACILSMIPRATAALCCGDCNGNGAVTIDELVKATYNALDECGDSVSTDTLLIGDQLQLGVNPVLGVGEITGDTRGTGFQGLLLQPSSNATLSDGAGRAIGIDFSVDPITIRNSQVYGLFFGSRYDLEASKADISLFNMTNNGVVNVTDGTFTTQVALSVAAPTVTGEPGTFLNSFHTFGSIPNFLAEDHPFVVKEYKLAIDEAVIKTQNNGSLHLDNYVAVDSHPIFDGGKGGIGTRHGLFLRSPRGSGTVNQFIGVDVDDPLVDYTAWSLLSHGDTVLLDHRGPAIFGASPVVSTTTAAQIFAGEALLVVEDSRHFAPSGVVRIGDRYYAYGSNDVSSGTLTLVAPFYRDGLGPLESGAPVTQYAAPVAQLDTYAAEPERVGHMVRGAPGQAADLTEWQDDAGNVLASVDAEGNFGAANLASGTYFPTVSNSINLDLTTATAAQYMRVGTTVTVSGRFTAAPSSAATSTSFELSLPIASRIVSSDNVSGTAVCGSVQEGAEVVGVTANDTAGVVWIAADIGNRTCSYTFTYQIL